MPVLYAIGPALALAGSMIWQVTWSLILGFTLSAVIQAVIELGIILALLHSWQFTLAEFVGGPIMIVAVAVAFRLFVRARLIDEARRQADRAVAGSLEGHAAMDMSIAGGRSLWRRLASRDGFTSVSHIFVMEWAAVLRDIAIGLLIAGAAAAWIPDSFWSHLFLAGHPAAR